ncbi:dicarboxylate/amino acid:cation symporter [Clostridium botulinum]|uniref:Sodium:dicarboxylate symporter n=3 Tax=Clostridium botulinum TaxID=1491 RepID=A0A9Q1ZBQ9_CLOBO|nr:dicarboxylate/amino acid:cation symporter [Clostridium botulinum]AEB76830.1 sodium:dicarboxylate symporter family protein [Clostridium botulinum BKT015925]KEH98242.1 sodium:dicarboxylate symporter [Clostridium botulinum C/D str. Sp77]KEI02588.1 sodium:dicarboxylate symporter [Clostridium botulinum D str. 16868]KLU74758.1 sodium:dicarboxylate symporter [Clostridium botulinum V891]KOA72599.1 sodium:dicarboxylate symporter [Clostridium botulinum]
MKKTKKISLAIKILLALAVGIIFGVIANMFFPKEINDGISKWILSPLGEMFLRSIKMLVVPLVLCSLICGVASIGDVKKLGRVGVKTIIYFLFTTAFAIVLAMLVANFMNPGRGIGINLAVGSSVAKTTKPPFIMDMFVNMIPTNPIESMVKGDMLQIIVFAILFGVCITLIGEKAKPLSNIVSEINEVLLKMINVIMIAAPVGVFALISKVIIFQGVSALIPLLKYLVTVTVALTLQVVIVYAPSLKILGGVNPIKFFKKFWPVMLVAFSTSSSNASIPMSLKTCEEKMGASKGIASFTIPLGSTVNMDGTSIMQGVGTVFIAQLVGVNLTLHQMLMVVLTATLASIGTAGVPGAGVVMLSMVLEQVGLPLEGIALVLSVDRIVDMLRTVVNVTGNAATTIIMCNSEKELDLNIYNDKI